MIAAKGANILIITILVGAVDCLNVTWGDCCGSVGIANKHPIVIGKIKQCETIAFTPGGFCRIPCDSVMNDLFRFLDFASYVSFDTTSIEQLANASDVVGEVGSPGEFSEPGFLVDGGIETRISYYGNHGGNSLDGELGRKKIAIKTVPDFVERYMGYHCSKGSIHNSFKKQFLGRRNEKRCRALCKRTEGCVAYEFSYRTQRRRGRVERKVNRCKIYFAFLPSAYPFKGKTSRQYVVCNIARKTCDDEILSPGV